MKGGEDDEVTKKAENMKKGRTDAVFDNRAMGRTIPQQYIPGVGKARDSSHPLPYFNRSTRLANKAHNVAFIERSKRAH